MTTKHTCANCGAIFADDQRFCSNCGYAVTPQPVERKQSQLGKGCLTLVGALLLAGLARAFLSGPLATTTSKSVIQATQTGTPTLTISTSESNNATPLANTSTVSATIRVAANFRSGPGTEFSIYRELPAGTQVNVVSAYIAEDSKWYKVLHQRQEGWVSGTVLDLPSELAAQIPQEVNEIHSEESTSESSSVNSATDQVGEPQVAGGIGVIGAIIRRTPTLNQFQRAASGNEFLIVQVGIMNVSRDSTPYNPLYFKLRDSDGFEYNPLLMNPLDRSLKSGDLERKELVQGLVVFEVPSKANEFTLIYEPLVLLGGYEPIKILLK